MATPINYPTPIYTATFATVATFSAEQVAALSPVVNINSPQAGVSVRFTGQLTVGTAGVTASYKIRRGSTTGGSLPTYGGQILLATVVATDVYDFVVEGYDLPGQVNGQGYCLTVTVGSASAVSTVANVLGTCIVTGSS